MKNLLKKLLDVKDVRIDQTEITTDASGVMRLVVV